MRRHLHCVECQTESKHCVIPILWFMLLEQTPAIAQHLASYILGDCSDCSWLLFLLSSTDQKGFREHALTHGSPGGCGVRIQSGRGPCFPHRRPQHLLFLSLLRLLCKSSSTGVRPLFLVPGPRLCLLWPGRDTEEKGTV